MLTMMSPALRRARAAAEPGETETTKIPDPDLISLMVCNSLRRFDRAFLLDEEGNKFSLIVVEDVVAFLSALVGGGDETFGAAEHEQRKITDKQIVVA